MLMMSPGLLDHADDARVAGGIQADGAQLLLGEVEALTAEAHDFLDLDEGMGERQRLLGRELQQVERQALRGLGTDARQLAQFVYEPLDGGAEHAPALDRLGRSRP